MAKNSKGIVTQKMIADKLRVHSTTVSMALRGVECIPEKTRNRILAAAREMGYVPNIAARSLRTRRTGLIGMIGDPSFGEIMARRIATTARLLHERGYELMLFYPPEPGQSFEPIIQSLTAHWVAGVVIADTRAYPMPEMLLEWLRPLPARMSFLPWEPLHDNLVDTDRHEGQRAAVHYLYEQGHRRIAMNIWPRAYWNAPLPRARLDGWRQGMAECGLEARDEYLIEYLLDDATETAAAMQKLAKLDPRPTAVISAGDQAALMSIRHLQRLGVRVPADISVIGFDDGVVAASSLLPLTTMAQQVDELSRLSAHYLVEMIEGKIDQTFKPVMVPPKLVVRDTVAPPPAG